MGGKNVTAARVFEALLFCVHIVASGSRRQCCVCRARLMKTLTWMFWGLCALHRHTHAWCFLNLALCVRSGGGESGGAVNFTGLGKRQIHREYRSLSTGQPQPLKFSQISPSLSLSLSRSPLLPFSFSLSLCSFPPFVKHILWASGA